MKSILIEKPNQLAIVEREIPTPSAGEVRVKVKLAGICGSDSHIYRGHNPFAKYPRVIGHEFFGVIDAVGDGVESGRVGERVAVDPVVSSNDCAGAGILVIGFTSRLELTTHQRHYGLSASYCGGSDFGYWCWRGIWQSAGGIGRRQSPCQHATND